MKYSKAIILYGILVPTAIIGALAFAMFIGFKAFSVKASAKEQRWTAHKERIVKNSVLEKRLAPVRTRISFEKDLLVRDIQGTLGQFLDQELTGTQGARLIRQSLDFPPAIANDASVGSAFRKVDMGFIGRFDGMQHLAMNTETKFPQLSLMSYNVQRVQPTKTVPSPHLAFKVTFKSYTAEK